MKVESDAFGSKYHCDNREDIKLLLKEIEELHNSTKVVNYVAAAAIGLVAGREAGTVAGGYSFAQDHSLKLLESALRDRVEAGKAIVVYIPHLIQGWTIDP